MNDGIETIVHCSIMKFIDFVASWVKTNVNKSKCLCPYNYSYSQ